MKTLTLNKARELTRLLFGTDEGLRQTDISQCYEIRFGRLVVNIRSDCEIDECIMVTIEYTPLYRNIQQMANSDAPCTLMRMFDFDTLEELFDFENQNWHEEKTDMLHEWVCSMGAEYCRNVIDQLSNL